MKGKDFAMSFRPNEGFLAGWQWDNSGPERHCLCQLRDREEWTSTEEACYRLMLTTLRRRPKGQGWASTSLCALVTSLTGS